MENASDAGRRSWRGWLFDILVAGFMTGLTVPLTDEVASLSGAPVGVAMANGVLHGGSLVLRRVVPVWVVVALAITAVVHVALGLGVAFLGPPALVGLYTVAVLRPHRMSLTALSGAVVILVAGTLVVDAAPEWDSLALYAVLLSAAWWLGDLVRQRQLQAALHAERAEQLQQARLELARHAVTEERLRIARELHDVIVHSLTAVSVHAGTARLALDADPPAARQALETIERTTRGALGELRQLLSVLRDTDGPPDASLAPSPRLDRLNDLIAESVDAGLAVDVAVTGDLTRLSPGLNLTAFRIVQEALTNVLRHASARHATVTVQVEPAQLRILIEDDGHARPDGHERGNTGHGLVGMRERVTIYGGDLRAGRGPDGGFRVEARMPLPPEPG